jgi:hypothetical protein
MAGIIADGSKCLKAHVAALTGPLIVLLRQDMQIEAIAELTPPIINAIPT